MLTKATEAKPVKKSSSPGGMGGWDWGFKSTSKKTATPKTAAAAPKKPVFSEADEAAEIEAVKRKAAAEIKAEQEQAKVNPKFDFRTGVLRHLADSSIGLSLRTWPELRSVILGVK